MSQTVIAQLVQFRVHSGQGTPKAITAAPSSRETMGDISLRLVQPVGFAAVAAVSMTFVWPASW